MDYPLRNGYRHDWSSVELKLDGDVYVGVREVKYSHTMNRTKLRGTHPVPLGRTRGEYDCEASISLWLAEAEMFRAKLGDGYMEKFFDVVVSYTENGETYTDTLVNCQLKKDEGGGSQSPDGLSVAWDLDVERILINGREPTIQTLEQRAASVPQT